MGDLIRRQGHEFGTTTGRPRRCGWFDVVIARYSTRINGLSHLAVTKLDVLSGLAEIKICIAYKLNDQIINNFPASLKVLAQCEPVYETMPGWQEDITEIKNIADLPLNARRYLDRLTELTEVPVALIGVGQKRSQTIVVEELF